MSTPTSILIIGLDFAWTAVHRADQIDPATLRSKVQPAIQKLSGVPGLEPELYLLNPEKKEALDEIEAKMRAGHGGKPWSGVIIGWGVRAFADTSPLLESLVNIVKDSSPESRLIFPDDAPNHLEAIQRNFPQLQGSS